MADGIGWWAPHLATRRPGPELMDRPGEFSSAELEECLAGLRTINRRFGGLATTRRALDGLAGRVRPPGSGWTVLDIGGGSGDAVPTILSWGRERGVPVRVTTMDLEPRSAREASRRLASLDGVEALAGDLFAVPPRSYDVVHGALFLHHFDGEEAVRALRQMGRVARAGIALNDLRRSAAAWTVTRWMTLAITRNRLVRHDGPLSVARGFREEDWRSLGAAAGLDLRWERTWPWRFAVTAPAG